MKEKTDTIISLAKSCLGYPYVYAALGELCTPSSRRGYSRSDYPSIITDCQVLRGEASNCENCKYKNSRIFDCRGFTYWLLKQVGISISPVGATTQYATTKDWVRQGPISEMPNLVCCVFKKNGDRMSHTGMHIGDGKIIHCSGEVKYGKTTDYGWTHYAIPKGLYTDEELTNAKEVVIMKNLKKGDKGTDVQKLQENLNKLGYNCGNADGIFGAKTDAAVRKFQQAEGLKVDGIAGEKTQTLLNQRIAELDGDSSAPTPAPVTPSDDYKEFLKQIKGELEEIIRQIDEKLNV